VKRKKLPPSIAPRSQYEVFGKPTGFERLLRLWRKAKRVAVFVLAILGLGVALYLFLASLGLLSALALFH